MLHCFLFCFCILQNVSEKKTKQIQIWLIYKNPLHVRNSAASWDIKTQQLFFDSPLLWICHFNSFSKSPKCFFAQVCENRVPVTIPAGLSQSKVSLGHRLLISNMCGCSSNNGDFSRTH